MELKLSQMCLLGGVHIQESYASKPRDGGYTDINLNFDTGAAIPQIITLHILFHINTS